MGLGTVGLRASRGVRREVRRRLIGRRLRAGEPLRPGPSWVQIGIEERCNYRCGMCWAHSYRLPRQDRRAALSREAFGELVDQLRDLGTERLDVAGTGEPMLHPDVLVMLEQVKWLGMKCVLITNGSRLTPEACEHFIEIGLDTLNVSLNAATDETHQRVSGGPAGQCSQILTMLGYLVEQRNRRGAAGPCVSISFVVQKDNYGEIAQVAREAIRRGCDRVLYMALGINEASRELALSPAEEGEAQQEMEEARRLLGEAGCGTNADHYLRRQRGEQWSRAIVTQTPCCVGQFFCRILADGSVDPCGVSRRVVGSVTRERFTDVWCGTAYRAFRREAFSLPKLGRPVEACGCYTCNHAQTILSYYQKLRVGQWPEIIM